MSRYKLRPVVWLLRMHGAVWRRMTHSPASGTRPAPSFLSLLTSSSSAPFCLYGQGPQLFQPCHQTSTLLPHSNCHSPLSIQLAKRANAGLRLRGTHLWAQRLSDWSCQISPIQISITPQNSAQTLLLSPTSLSHILMCLDILDHPSLSQCSQVIITAYVSGTSFSPKLFKIQGPFSGTH